ncbi:MAG TPA: hypothetical protein VGF81_01660 [Solirubrobacteraceae bacterium]
MPAGHVQTLQVRRGLSRRERWMIGAVLATVAAVAIALAVSLATAGPSSARGCIHATLPGVVGAVQVNECGASARSICASVYAPGAYAPGAAQTLAGECRKAGLPITR